MNEVTDSAAISASMERTVNDIRAHLSECEDGYDLGYASDDLYYLLAEHDRLTGDLARVTAERDAMREVVSATRAYKQAVDDAVAHQGPCDNSPCQACEDSAFIESSMETLMFNALIRFDSGELGTRRA